MAQQVLEDLGPNYIPLWFNSIDIVLLLIWSYNPRNLTVDLGTDNPIMWDGPKKQRRLDHDYTWFSKRDDQQTAIAVICYCVVQQKGMRYEELCRTYTKSKGTKNILGTSVGGSPQKYRVAFSAVNHSARIHMLLPYPIVIIVPWCFK